MEREREWLNIPLSSVRGRGGRGEGEGGGRGERGVCVTNCEGCPVMPKPIPSSRKFSQVPSHVFDSDSCFVLSWS